MRLPLEIDGKRHQIGLPRSLLAGLSNATPHQPAPAPGADDAAIHAPIAGSIQAWKVEDKDVVKEGDLLAVMEAMKMEVQITASRAGTVRLAAKPGAFVNAGDVIGAVRIGKQPLFGKKRRKNFCSFGPAALKPARPR